jgi:hypothetical protein
VSDRIWRFRTICTLSDEVLVIYQPPLFYVCFTLPYCARHFSGPFVRRSRLVTSFLTLGMSHNPAPHLAILSLQRSTTCLQAAKIYRKFEIRSSQCQLTGSETSKAALRVRCHGGNCFVHSYVNTADVFRRTRRSASCFWPVTSSESHDIHRNYWPYVPHALPLLRKGLLFLMITHLVQYLHDQQEMVH